MNPEKIGKMIKDIRKKENLTQEKFGEIFGVTYQAVSKWENGKNIPDLAILTEICTRYHYDIHEFLTGEKKRKKQYFFVIGIFLFVFFLLLLLIFLFQKDSFTFKTLSSNCDNFTITGSMAYNKEKTSIFISDVSYCGEKDLKKYVDLECTLYETNGNTKTIIDTCNFMDSKSILLDDFLKNIKFQVDDYAKTCKYYKEDSLYLEIDAKEENGDIRTFKIPIKLESNCLDS